MISVVNSQREILLSPTGTNVWSGQVPQGLNSAAVTWSLAKQLYGFDGPYWNGTYDDPMANSQGSCFILTLY